MKSRKIISITLALITALFAVMSCIPTALAAEYQANGATYFTFTDGGITVSEGTYDGYKIEGTSLTINDSGTYVLSGSCADGSVKVKKGTTGVTLVLSGLTLTSSTTAPIACNKSTEVRIIVASGSVNALTDSAKNNDDNYPDNTNAENAVIKCKDGSQVTLSGSGTLNITANGKSGIKSGATTDEEGEARMTISDLTLNITASLNDAINAEQLLNVTSGNITISAGDDAIHSDYILNIGSENGEGPVINIKNCHDGLEAATLNVYSGNITIHASDDCLNAANSDLSGYAFSLNIYGGNLVMDTTSGDGVDSNGSLTISGGTLVIWSANTAGNQPLDADGTITISGGTVLAADGSGSTGGNGGNQPSGNQGGSNTTPNDQTDSFETDAPDNSSADSTASSSSDSNTGLWIAIGVLSAALAVIIILLCKTHKK